jgi:hypothetical protein
LSPDYHLQAAGFQRFSISVFSWSHFVPVNSQLPFCLRESTRLMIAMFIVFPQEVPIVRSSPRVRRPLPSTVALSAALPPMIQGGTNKSRYFEISVSSAVLADE